MTVDVTVVMPAMNREHFIGQALESIRAQSCPPKSVIVIDDASTDQTVRVAREHGAEVIELAVNGGSGPARNRGIEAAATEWIAFLDSDDMWEPRHLERLMQRKDAGHVLLAAPGISTGGRTMGNASSRELPLTPLRALASDLICTSGTMVRRDALLAAGMFRPLRRAQDMDMWVRVLEHGTGLALAEPGFVYRLHDQQAINDSELMRACVDDIVARASAAPWFRRGDVDRVYATRNWDEARAAQRERRYGPMARQLGWFVRRPHTWPTLGFAWQQRLQRRRRVRTTTGTTI